MWWKRAAKREEEFDFVEAAGFADVEAKEEEEVDSTLSEEETLQMLERQELDREEEGESRYWCW